MSKVKYYSLNKILELDADYNMIYGERSNGKTTAVLMYALEDHVKSNFKNQLGYIRRWEEDFKGKNGSALFKALIEMGYIEKITDGRFNSIYYYGQRWFLCKYDEEGNKVFQMDEPFCLGFSLTSEEHYKSTAYPNIKTIFFDEFITRSYYLPNEFIAFTNLISTIVRLREDVKIFMCGNTINKYCIYFNEMGLTNIKKQKQGTIDLYTYGESTLKVAVEYSDFDKKNKKSNKYFAFDNPKLDMIKNGAWEIALYPHLPHKYNKSDIKYTYYINFDDELLQCEIIKSRELKTYFTFIHRKTTPIKEDETNAIFSPVISANKNRYRKITKPINPLTKAIYKFFIKDKIFYQDNEVGEVVRNYIMWCKKEAV